MLLTIDAGNPCPPVAPSTTPGPDLGREPARKRCRPCC
ncbi:hypothetical protein JOF35_001347 [Streptomyces demainii]|uniref:Uncharacterized protein n=1 Tax=Streptomyces demainii TaxID=588122 RepID=A0ABT9KKX4_9ACTN|nr:hypothetical protein [Streptomyces demainii]